MPREHTIDHRFEWRHLTLLLSQRINYRGEGWCRLELSVVSPRGHPLPMTGTHRFAQELDEDQLRAMGGAVQRIRNLLERDQASQRYCDALYRWRQMHLLDARRAPP